MAGESIKSGLTAGFTASAALGALMVIKTQLGILPELNPIGDIVAIVDRYTGLQFPPDTGWVGHFVIGAVGWGIIYTWIRKILPGPAVVKGLVFGVLAWLVMMIVFMPVAGRGFFGLSLGIAAPIATFVLHLVFGAVLGAVYASTRSEPPPSITSRQPDFEVILPLQRSGQCLPITPALFAALFPGGFAWAS
jgi:hypothetical protein